MLRGSLPFICLVVISSLLSHGLWHPRLLCPWSFPGQNTGVGFYFLLQEIFPSQESKLHLLPWQADSSLLSHQENPSHDYIILCKNPSQQIGEQEILLLSSRSKQPFVNCPVEGHMALNWHGLQDLKVDSCRQLVRSWGLQSYHHIQTDSYNN